MNTIIASLKDFCENSTIAGLCYISKKRLHFVERVFWLVCIIFSAYGAYYLINDYRNEFEMSSVSIVYESVRAQKRVEFPALSVCPNGLKEPHPKLDDFIEKYTNCGPECDDYDDGLSRQMLTFIYPFIYNKDIFSNTCKPRENCQDCNKCVGKEERRFVIDFNYQCKEVFVECIASGLEFDCCHYFLPFVTPVGKCFLFNSLQNNERGSENWYNTFNREVINITIVTKQQTQVSVLNFEDIPTLIVPGTSISLGHKGRHRTLQVYLEKIVNDQDVNEISIDYRKCRDLHDVLPNSLYKVHSFSACLSDCLRLHQMRLCNCTIQSLVPDENNAFPPCNLNGLYCLEEHSIVRPDGKNLLPSSQSGTACQCLPSCTESTIQTVYESDLREGIYKKFFEITVYIPIEIDLIFRRQAIRTRLDAIVTIGGTLGLFLGASLLSGAEVFCYFIFWICSPFFGTAKYIKLRFKRRFSRRH